MAITKITSDLIDMSELSTALIHNKLYNFTHRLVNDPCFLDQLNLDKRVRDIFKLSLDDKGQNDYIVAKIYDELKANMLKDTNFLYYLTHNSTGSDVNIFPLSTHKTLIEPLSFYNYSNLDATPRVGNSTGHINITLPLLTSSLEGAEIGIYKVNRCPISITAGGLNADGSIRDLIMEHKCLYNADCKVRFAAVFLKAMRINRPNGVSQGNPEFAWFVTNYAGTGWNAADATPKSL